MEYGKRLGNKTLLIPREQLTESVPGQIYEIVGKVSGVGDPALAIATVSVKLEEKFPLLKVHWAEIADGTLRIELTGSPFLWSALLVYLPSLLSLLGIALSGISIYMVWSSVPSWAWGALVAGVALIFFGPKLTNILLPGE